MSTYRLIAVNAQGRGFTYGWGDAYQVEAENYLAAEADVLGREGTDGTQPYTRIVSGWVKSGWGWTRLPACEDCGNAVARTEWAESGRMICRDCCDVRQGRTDVPG